jgi:hypothetical protein
MAQPVASPDPRENCTGAPTAVVTSVSKPPLRGEMTRIGSVLGRLTGGRRCAAALPTRPDVLGASGFAVGVNTAYEITALYTMPGGTWYTLVQAADKAIHLLRR